MSQPQYIDILFDENTGETIIKLEGLADDLCEATAQKVMKQLGITDAKVIKTASHEGGDGAKRTQSIG